MPQSPDNRQNLDGDSFDSQISGQSFMKDNFLNSRFIYDIDMKLGPVTKFDKKIRRHQKKLMMMSCQQIVISLIFFQFMANLEQFGSQITEAWSLKLIFSLTLTLYLKKSQNRTKKYLTQLSYYCFE